MDQSLRQTARLFNRQPLEGQDNLLKVLWKQVA